MPNAYVNKVELADGTSLIDISDTTAEASDVASGKYFYTAAGEKVEGTASGGGGVGISQDQDGFLVLDPNGSGGGGGGNPVAAQKQINFVDYDGTIRYSYSAAEFAGLSDLPPNPSHTGRTAQGWNWTLAQINAQLADCPDGPVWVGQNYTTADGKTHIRIVIPAGTPSSRMTFYVRYTQTASHGVTVDWGDGSTPESHSDSGYNLGHSYSSPGEYDITLDVTSGTVSFVGSSSSGIYGSTEYRYNRSYIREIAFGDNVTGIGDYALYGVYGSILLSMPSGVSAGGYYTYGYALGLVHQTIPSGTTSVSERMLRYCYALDTVSIPSSVTSIGSNAFAYCSSLRNISIPVGVTSIGESAFAECYALTNVSIPSSVTSIGASAFSSCSSVGAYHVRATTPPSLGSSAFSSIPSDCVIYVPSGSVNAYKSSWSAYSSYIQAEPS